MNRDVVRSECNPLVRRDWQAIGCHGFGGGDQKDVPADV
jgi:hypothetical protein